MEEHTFVTVNGLRVKIKMSLHVIIDDLIDSRPKPLKITPHAQGFHKFESPDNKIALCGPGFIPSFLFYVFVYYFYALASITYIIHCGRAL